MIKRGGVLPYVQTSQGKLYLFAIDNDYQNYIDFGGHREDFDEDILATIQREVEEETYGSLYFSRDDLLNGEQLYDDNTLLVVCKMENVDGEELLQHIMEALVENGKYQRLESIAVCWVHEDKLKIILSMDEETAGHFMYPVIYKNLKKNL
jgi:hypothetical protein